MTQKKLFYKKIIYIVLIAILLFPLYRLGSPSQRKAGGELSQGGTLAQIREANGLAEADLGQIDPASSTMKLATFGMRGVAIALLWNRSLNYEKKADWNNVVATGNQIIMLEPHFISIWDFVGWKLAYNASAQYDDYRERYRWVIRGFEFLQKGTNYNQTSPKLFGKAGWTISQKIGVADEKNQYRRLFREDDAFHDKQTFKERDNWLFGRNFYLQAEQLYERGGDIGKETRIIFYGRRPMNLIRYAEWMELDGCGYTKDNTPLFDEEHAASAWREAQEQWDELSRKKIQTIIEDRKEPGKTREMSLNEYNECNAEMNDLMKELESMLPEGKTIDSVIWDRWNTILTDQQRASLCMALENPAPEYDPVNGKDDYVLRVVRDYLDGKHGEQPDWANWRQKLQELQITVADESIQPILQKKIFLRTSDEDKETQSFFENMSNWREQAVILLRPTAKILADLIEGENHQRALDICDRVDDLTYQANFSKMYRDIMDSSNAERRMQIEQLPEAREATEHRYLARIKFYSGQHEEANNEFLASMASWKALYDKSENKDIRFNSTYQTRFLDEIDKYTIILDQLERIFPEDYPFEEVASNVIEKDGTKKYLNLYLEFLQNHIQEQDTDSGVSQACSYLRNWKSYFESSDYTPLFPTKASRDGVRNGTAVLAQVLEQATPEKLSEIKASGLLDNYPCRGQLELLLNKGESLYTEIQQTEMQTITDPDKGLEHREKTIELWGELLAKYPILKFDSNSPFYAQIQNAAVDYLARLKEAGRDKPENFVLESFLPQ